MKDREIDSRLAQQAAQSMILNFHVGPRVIHLRLDGMDQAKFKCPRNVQMSKLFEPLWRPQLH
eukprot:12420024-Alexandrium_andersonii.AAC.1